jgi:hypothetical protein
MIQELGTESNLDESMEWLFKNTNFPSFAEFAKNPDKWRANKNDLFEAIEKNSTAYKISKHRYFWRGIYEVDTLEKIQKIAEDEGYDGTELEMQPLADQVLGDPGNWDKSIEMKVNIWPKGEFKAMGGVVANET